jgi:hypothetical protein
MARDISNNLKKQLYDPNMTDPFLFLVELSHPDWAETFYYVNNNEEIISNGKTYVPVAFQITLPQDDGETLPQVKLEIDNVSREMIEEIRTVTSPISVNLLGVLASDPDYIELEYAELSITAITYDAQKISGDLILVDFLNQKIPGEIYSPISFPGLF